MKKCAFIVVFLMLVCALWAQQKYALVIGNAAYTGAPWGVLRNPVNDANSMERALKELGFTVTVIRNGTKDEMEKAVFDFRQKLRTSYNTYGFFYYAGHGTQHNGENYLVPVNARTPRLADLEANTMSVGFVMQELELAKNELNMIVLDACRNLPDQLQEELRQAEARGGPNPDAIRGLANISKVPQGTIIMYATAANRTADDGAVGGNGLFTSHLLRNLSTPGIEVKEIFNRTGAAVVDATKGSQFPETRTMYYGTAYLGSRPVQPEVVQPVPEGLEWEIVDGNSVTITNYTGNAATVNIPERIQGLPVTAIGPYKGEWQSRSFTNIIIPSSVTYINKWAFCMNNSLTSITVDSRNPAYTSVDGVLFDKNIRTIIRYPVARKGTNYVIPSSVTSISEGAFYFCNSLTNITIPSSVTAIGDLAFYGSSLTSIAIPSSVITIGDYAFAGCNSLTNITIPSSVTSIGGGAFISTNLTSITVDSRNPAYTSVDGVLFDKNIRTIISYPQDKKGTNYIIPSSVTSIGKDAFSECSGLTGITIPSSVTSIGIHAFSYCSNLTSINIPSSVTAISYRAFSMCTSLTSITIPSSVTAIGDLAFSYCSNLTSITLSRRTRVGENAFPDSARITYRD